MPKMARAVPPRMIHQVISLKRASMKSPSWTFLTTLTVMPVKIWIRPMTRDAPMISMVFVRGVKRAGISKVLAGLMIFKSWGMKSPKKPPVSAPTINVLTPHQKNSSMKLGFFGLVLRRTNWVPAIISRP